MSEILLETRVAVSLDRVTKRFGTLKAVHDVSLDVLDDEFVVLLGRSGSGKSTLLRLVNGLEQPSEGTVSVFDQEVSEQTGNNLRRLRSQIGMVFQQFNLIGPLTVLENVLTGASARFRWPRLGLFSYPKSSKVEAFGHLERVGMAEFCYQRADTLSGGQQQRVAIARALMQRPRVLLADEPVASLDPESSQQVLRLIRDIGEEDGLTVLCSLHQVELARQWSDRIVGLRNGQIVLDAPAAEVTEERAMLVYAAPVSDSESNHLAVAGNSRPLTAVSA